MVNSTLASRRLTPRAHWLDQLRLEYWRRVLFVTQLACRLRTQLPEMEALIWVPLIGWVIGLVIGLVLAWAI